METEAERAAVVLAPETPYPLAGGGALRTASLLHYLARTRPVDLIVFRQPGAADPCRDLPSGLVRRAAVIDLPRNRRDRAARAWRNAGRVAREVPPLMDRFAGFEREVRTALEERRYAIGVIEHFWCAPYVEVMAPCCERTLVDLHNLESRLHELCAATGPGPEAFAHHVYGRAARELERFWLPRFSGVLAASQNDACAARAIAPGASVSVYHNSIPWTPEPRTPREDAIVFSGNMAYHPNTAAVRFFRERIWPELRERRPELVWRLVGKNPEAVRAFTAGDPRIEVCGPVEDAIAELARAKAAVVPLLAGSGTRLKILEAWAAVTPVVSTSIGAEGLPARDGVELLLADRPADFAGAVLRLLDSEALRRDLGCAGRRRFENEFTWEAAWRGLTF